MEETFFGRSISLEVGFGVSKAQTRACPSLFMLPENHDEELLATYLEIRLLVCWYVPCFDNNELNH